MLSFLCWSVSFIKMSRYTACICVTLLRIIILSLLVHSNSNLNLYSNFSLSNLLFHSILFLAIVFYLRVSLSDPGFLTKCPSSLLRTNRRETKTNPLHSDVDYNRCSKLRETKRLNNLKNSYHDNFSSFTEECSDALDYQDVESDDFNSCNYTTNKCRYKNRKSEKDEYVYSCIKQNTHNSGNIVNELRENKSSGFYRNDFKSGKKCKNNQDSYSYPYYYGSEKEEEDEDYDTEDDKNIDMGIFASCGMPSHITFYENTNEGKSYKNSHVKALEDLANSSRKKFKVLINSMKASSKARIRKKEDKTEQKRKLRSKGLADNDMKHLCNVYKSSRCIKGCDFLIYGNKGICKLQRKKNSSICKEDATTEKEEDETNKDFMLLKAEKERHISKCANNSYMHVDMSSSDTVDRINEICKCNNYVNFIKVENYDMVVNNNNSNNNSNNTKINNNIEDNCNKNNESGNKIENNNNNNKIENNNNNKIENNNNNKIENNNNNNNGFLLHHDTCINIVRNDTISGVSNCIKSNNEKNFKNAIDFHNAEKNLFNGKMNNFLEEKIANEFNFKSQGDSYESPEISLNVSTITPTSFCASSFDDSSLHSCCPSFQNSSLHNCCSLPHVSDFLQFCSLQRHYDFSMDYLKSSLNSYYQDKSENIYNKYGAKVNDICFMNNNNKYAFNNSKSNNEENTIDSGIVSYTNNHYSSEISFNNICGDICLSPLPFSRSFCDSTVQSAYSNNKDNNNYLYSSANRTENVKSRLNDSSFSSCTFGSTLICSGEHPCCSSLVECNKSLCLEKECVISLSNSFSTDKINLNLTVCKQFEKETEKQVSRILLDEKTYFNDCRTDLNLNKGEYSYAQEIFKEQTNIKSNLDESCLFKEGENNGKHTTSESHISQKKKGKDSIAFLNQSYGIDNDKYAHDEYRVKEKEKFFKKKKIIQKKNNTRKNLLFPFAASLENEHEKKKNCKEANERIQQKKRIENKNERQNFKYIALHIDDSDLEKEVSEDETYKNKIHTHLSPSRVKHFTENPDDYKNPDKFIDGKYLKTNNKMKTFSTNENMKDETDSLNSIFTIKKRRIYQSGVRLRFCSECRMYQPLRTKHCEDCHKCVRTHDHHCPWIGTCVGERNRCWFYWFLFFEFIEIIWIMCEIVKILVIQDKSNNTNFNEWDFVKIGLIISFIILIFLSLMVFFLFFYHTFLALTNATTWEKLAWEKITYLKQFSESRGTPFSRGIWSNLAVYCCASSPKIFRFFCFCDRTLYGPHGEVLWEAGEQHIPSFIHLLCRPCFD